MKYTSTFFALTLFTFLITSCMLKRNEHDLVCPGNPGHSEHSNDNSQWQSKSTSIADSLLDVDFTNEKTGYISGIGGVLIKTTDGGQSFSYLHSGTTHHLYSIKFINSTTGFAVGDAGTILKTTDAGATWNIVNSGTTKNFRRVYFYNERIGFISGGLGALIKTTDGGTTWQALYPGTSDGLYGIFFTDVNTGYISGLNGTILKTTDGGTSWTPQASGIPVGPTILLSIHFADANNGIIVGGIGNPSFTPNPVILKTTNGGATWLRITSPTTTSVFSQVKFSNANTGYIVGGTLSNNSGTLLKTTDGGTSWSQIPLSTYRLTGIDIINQNLAFAVGLNGAVLKGN